MAHSTRIRAATTIQANYRGFILRLHVVHEPRNKYLEISKEILQSLEVNNDVNLPSFPQKNQLAYPQFDSYQSKIDLNIDVRSTIELEEELRMVRERLSSSTSVNMHKKPNVNVLSNWNGQYDCLSSPEINGFSIVLIPYPQGVNSDVILEFPTNFWMNRNMSEKLNMFYISAYNPHNLICTKDENMRANILLSNELGKLVSIVPNLKCTSCEKGVSVDLFVETGFLVTFYSSDETVVHDLLITLFKIAKKYGRKDILSYNCHYSFNRLVNVKSNVQLFSEEEQSSKMVYRNQLNINSTIGISCKESIRMCLIPSKHVST